MALFLWLRLSGLHENKINPLKILIYTWVAVLLPLHYLTFSYFLKELIGLPLKVIHLHQKFNIFISNKLFSQFDLLVIPKCIQVNSQGTFA